MNKSKCMLSQTFQSLTRLILAGTKIGPNENFNILSQISVYGKRSCNKLRRHLRQRAHSRRLLSSVQVIIRNIILFDANKSNANNIVILFLRCTDANVENINLWSWLKRVPSAYVQMWTLSLLCGRLFGCMWTWMGCVAVIISYRFYFFLSFHSLNSTCVFSCFSATFAQEQQPMGHLRCRRPRRRFFFLSLSRWNDK